MSVPFNSIPSGLRIPFVAVEYDNTRAQQGPAVLNYRGILIGQKTAGGSAPANYAYPVTTADQVAQLAGRGSMLHRMALAWFACNQFTPISIGVLADNGGGSQAEGSIEFTGPSTAPGTLAIYLGGVSIAVAVTSGLSAAQIATAVEAAINDEDDLPVTASIDSSTPDTVALTFRHKGEVGNQYDIRLNYQDTDTLPAGIGYSVTQLFGGATNPSLATLIANMGEAWYQIWAMPYTDGTTLTAVENELADRFGPMRSIDGFCFTAKNDSLANLGTLGASRNSPHVSILDVNNSPTPAMEFSASIAAVVINATADDSALPLHRIVVPWILPPAESDRRTATERNTFAYEGISTVSVNGAQVQTDTLISTYETNTAGSPDTSYLYARDLLLLLDLRYSWRVQVANKYPRAKLALSSTKFGAGQIVVTPDSARGDAIAWFNQMQTAGKVQNGDQFARDLVVEIQDGNPNRLNFLLPPMLIGQLIVGATNLQFRLAA